jgi:4-oxalocrotonate tautomerase
MPNIMIDGPPLKNMESKRILVKKITDAAQEAYGLDRSAFVVIVRENEPENVAVGGRLLSDRSAGS